MKLRITLLIVALSASGCGQVAKGVVKAVGRGGAKAAPKAVGVPVRAVGGRVGQKLAGEAAQHGIQAATGNRDDRKRR